ncbi:MAG: phosphonoacetaldehyde hydrolase [Ignavibacteria bacterium]|jgi:phosphonoacetaldehyde hydrolase
MEFYFKRSYKGNVKGLVFDWAGTTVDFGCMAPTTVFIEVFKQKGIEITLEEARTPMGLHKKDHIREISEMDRVQNEWGKINGSITENDIDEMFNNFVPMQIDILKKYTDIIPGTVKVINQLRKNGLKIGSTTGYNNAMMEIVMESAKKQGYEVDHMVCATDVPYGRPAPWMAFKNAMEFNIYPMEAMVKIGDTISDIEEGLNAGMWSVGIVIPGNEMGMTEKQINDLSDNELNEKIKTVKQKFHKAGAHFTIDTIADLPFIIDEINERIYQGEKP